MPKQRKNNQTPTETNEDAAIAVMEDAGDAGGGDEGQEPERNRKRDRRVMSFDEYVNSLTSAEWETRKLYIVREGRTDIQDALKAEFKGKHSAIVAGPFDPSEPFGSDYLQRHFGGGSYLVRLNWKHMQRPDHIERQYTYSDIEGAEIWTSRERQCGFGVDVAAEEEEVAEKAAAADVMDRMVDRLEAAHAREVEAVKESAAPLLRAEAGAVEMTLAATGKVIEHMTARAAAPAAPSIGDRVIEAVINNSLKPPADPFDQLLKFMELKNKLDTPKENPAPSGGLAGGLLSQIGELKGVLEVLGINLPTPGALAAVTPEPPSMAERLMELLGKALEHEPMAYVNAFLSLRTGMARLKEEELNATIRARAAGAQPVAGSPALPAGAAPAQPSPQQVLMTRMMDVFARSFLSGLEPEDAAQVIADGFAPEFTSVAGELLKIGGEQWWTSAALLQGLGQSFPALGSVVTDPRFPAWIERFWAGWITATTAPATPQPEAETAATAS